MKNKSLYDVSKLGTAITMTLVVHCVGKLTMDEIHALGRDIAEIIKDISKGKYK